MIDRACRGLIEKMTRTPRRVATGRTLSICSWCMIVVGCVASQFTVRRTSLRPTSFMSVKKAAPLVRLAKRMVVGDADREAGLGRARERKRCAGESKGESEPLHPSSFLGR